MRKRVRDFSSRCFDGFRRLLMCARIKNFQLYQ